jgi:hypothetical protein
MSYSTKARFTPRQWFQHRETSAVPTTSHISYRKGEKSWSQTPRMNNTPIYHSPRLNYNYSSPRSYNYHKWNGTVYDRSVTNKPVPPGQRLFKALSNYANTLYSLKLAEIDIQLAMKSPKRAREYYRILESLNQPQVKLLDGQHLHDINESWKKVEKAALQLTIENTKMAEIMYKLKLEELLKEIDSLLKLQIKYIPSCEKILKYTRPNMMKQRFYDVIALKIKTEMNFLINVVRDKFAISHSVTPPHPPECKSLDNDAAMELTFIDDHASTSRDTEQPKERVFKRPIQRKNQSAKKRILVDLDADSGSSTVDEESISKRPLVRTNSVSSVSSYNTDRGEVLETARTSPAVSFENISTISESKHMKAVTIEESLTEYISFSISNDSLPTISSPPDLPQKATIENSSAQLNLNHICYDLSRLSTVHYTIITIHGEGLITTPRTHLLIEIPPDNLDYSLLNCITSGKHIIEIFLPLSTVQQYEHHLMPLVAWTKSRRMPCVITIPSSFEQNMKDRLASESLFKVSRPFLHPLYTSPTT